MLKKVFKTVTEQFDQKLWMTVGLAVFFVSFFFVFACRLQKYLSEDKIRTWMAQAIEHPWTFGYAGLAFTIYISCLIYSVRLIIIQLYKIYSEKS